MEKCKATIQEGFLATESGQLSQVRKYWKEIGDIDTTDTFVLNNSKVTGFFCYFQHENVTGLIISAHCGHKDIVRWFLNNRANADLETNLGWRAIHFAAKCGHVATVDMLCSSGAAIDPVTLCGETPLYLALRSHMRDTVCKLVYLGARTDYCEGLIQHYIYRGILPPNTLVRTQKSSAESPNDRTPLAFIPILPIPAASSKFHVTDMQSHSSGDAHCNDFSHAVLNSDVLMNQLQYQSTSYDLELARRKRELIRRLPLLSCLSQPCATQFLQLIHRTTRADLPLDNRSLAFGQLSKLLLDGPVADGYFDTKRGLTGNVGEPYLRLIEVCLCESHCPLEIAVQLSRLAIKMTALGAIKQTDLNGSSVGDDYSQNKTNSPSTFISSYLSRLIRKLILKNNPQYRSGILAHLSRILSDIHSSNVPIEGTGNTKVSWSDLLSSSLNILSNLVRLGESLDQPINIHRFAQVIGLVARLLIDFTTKNEYDNFSARFSDLADILVGWGVDSSSVIKGINMNSIYTELFSGLSHWFLLSSSINTESEYELKIVNENIRDMISHLLEDSENSLTLAMKEYNISNSVRTNQKPSAYMKQSLRDPNIHLISVRFYLKILSSIFAGICTNLKCSMHKFNETFMLSDTLTHWIERLLLIAKTVSSCFPAMLTDKHFVNWRPPPANGFALNIPLTVLDGIESSIFELLACLLEFSDCSEADRQSVNNYVLFRVLRSNISTFSNDSLNSTLHLIMVLLKSTSLDTNVLSSYFGSHSHLHQFKSSFTARGVESPSQKVFATLCTLGKDENLQKFVCDLALDDFKLSISPLCSQLSYSAVFSSEAENLGLFSLALLASIFKGIRNVEKTTELRRILIELIEPNCFLQWKFVPPRLRIAILLFIDDQLLLTSLQPNYISNMLFGFLNIEHFSAIEINVLVKLVQSILTCKVLESLEQLNLFIRIVSLAKRILVLPTSLSSYGQNGFVECVNILIRHAFGNASLLSDTELRSQILHLSQLSSSYPCSQIQRAGSDLLLLIGSFTTPDFSFPLMRFYSEFVWFTTRRPDQSATSLISPIVQNAHSTNTGLVVSESAFPSLPAVAGVLGIITRGAPYSSKVNCSRLRILRSPQDWIRRLSSLISPLPSDYKQDANLLQCTSFIDSILWHAAWAMVDYKLKVAPWANPLKTFLALEGAMRAHLQVLPLNEKSSNTASIKYFHAASSESFSHQTKTRQMSNANLLLTFMGYLERIIFNATNGFAVALTRPMLPVCTFFSANENTCTQWFNRIRSLICRIADDLPLSPRYAVGPALQVASVVVHHSYAILKTIPSCQASVSRENWLTHLGQYATPSDILVRTAKALQNLGAWEEIQALAEWTDELFNSRSNPFSWLYGIASLTRGHWDKAILQLNTYLDHNLISVTTPTPESSKLDESNKHMHLCSTNYVTEALLQAYLREWNYRDANNLRDRVNQFQSKDSNSTSRFNSLDLNWSRLESLTKLSRWSYEPSPYEISKSDYSHSIISPIERMDSHLINAAYLHCSSQSSSFNDHLLHLVTTARQTATSLTRLPVINFLMDPDPNVSSITGVSLQNWLIRAAMFFNKQVSSVAKIADPLEFSSWIHLISSDCSDVHTDSELLAAQWACTNSSPQLAERLMIRAAKCLSLFGNEKLIGGNDSYFERLCNIASTDLHMDSKKFSQIHILRFYDSLARILWSTNEQRNFDSPSKMLAISMLTRGLKLSLIEGNQRTPEYHSTQCQLAVETALRLFDWLELPFEIDGETWAERIHHEAQESQLSNQKVSCAVSVAADLEFFSRLTDEPWVNGLPIITPDVLTSSSMYVTSNATDFSPASWTNRLLMMSTHLSPSGSSPIAWLKMANWCYMRGHKEVQQIHTAARSYVITDGHTHSTSVLLKLLQPEDYTTIVSIVGKWVDSNMIFDKNVCKDESNTELTVLLIGALVSFLTLNIQDQEDQSKNNGTCLDDKSKHTHLFHFSAICPDDVMDNQMQENLYLHMVTVFPQLPRSALTDDVSESLSHILSSITGRMYTLHTSAAQAYATFLTLAGHSSCEQPLMEKTISKLDTSTATLKILDLLCVPSRKLRNLIAGFLDQASPKLPEFGKDDNLLDKIHRISVPSNEKKCFRETTIGHTLGGPAVWEDCLPQLLVRLSLPDVIIRSCLVALLNRLIMSGKMQNGVQTWPAPSFRLAARLIFPAIVNSSDHSNIDYFVNRCSNDATKSQLGDWEYQPDMPTFSRSSISCPFSQVVTTLNNAGFGDLVQKVKTFIFELQRITLLWEELWMGSLVQHLDELTKKMSLLDSEMKRTAQLDDENLTFVKSPSLSQGLRSGDEKENRTLLTVDLRNSSDNILIPEDNSLDGTEKDQVSFTKETIQNIVAVKYAAVLQPTLDLLSQLSSLTLNIKPETPHEEWFQKTFGPIINDLLDALLHPIDVRDVKEPILLIRQLIHQLHTIHQPIFSTLKSTTRSNRVETNAVIDNKLSTGSISYLSLHQLSPKLSLMYFGSAFAPHSDQSSMSYGIPLPGHHGMETSHLVNRIAVLPTKTRPKRLVFRAQNGRTYPYLLKGLEDLRLDDRVLHLFELVNLAVAQSSSKSHPAVHTYARTYSITPLGVRSGLLQMVQGAIPLFSLYKRWQIRSKSAADGLCVSPTVNVPRPGELFHTRLKELMTISGQPYQPQARSSWPIETLRELLTSLEAETPPDLLSRELWASNPSSASWWQVTRTFAKSAGLLSSLGYLVGLGDRHLDNLLVDLSTGHIIHIDYNVCFDKGRNLRVAERVPFRLTRILRHALGPAAQDTLVRGTFRIAAEHGLQAARDVADPFLIHLKAFLIDPLIDWHQKRHTTVHTQVVTDFTHLSAFYGGGSATSHNHLVASTFRRLRRIKAETRLYAGLLIARLSELNVSASLYSACSALDAMMSRLSVWVELENARMKLNLLNEKSKILNNATHDDFIKSEYNCRELEDVQNKIKVLHENLIKLNDSWKDQITSQFQIFNKLKDPGWLLSIIMSNQSSDPDLSVNLSKYHSVAQIYLGNLNFVNLVDQLLDRFQQFHLDLNLLLKAPNLDISSVINFCSSYQWTVHIPANPIILRTLEQAAQISRDQIRELRRIKEEKSTLLLNSLDLTSVIRHEVDNLNLFVTDQGEAGITAYCWALLGHLLDVAGNALTLETNPKDWQTSSDDPSVNYSFESDSLEQLNVHTECLINLFSVLQHQPTGTWHFTAGYEADVQREVAFLKAVHDATSCLFQLRANLIRLLVPEAVESLLSTSPTVIQSFSEFVIKHMAKVESSNLRQMVYNFLVNEFKPIHPTDTRFQHVLVAVHLALTNSTAQMEEIALRVRSCFITAPAWLYVDVISQSVSVLMSRCYDWQSGATSLWGWRKNGIQPGSADSHMDANPDMSCSWVDEVYAAGLMTFVSILEDGLAHWSSIINPKDYRQDIAVKPFVDAIQRFIGRLASRIALPSLVSLAAGRLYCSLVENTGLSIRRLLLEAEFSGGQNVLVPVLNLSAEKLLENATAQLFFAHPVGVQHLRIRASNLIGRLVNRCSEISQYFFESSQLEIVERHQKHLVLSLSAYLWVYQPLSQELSNTEYLCLKDLLAALYESAIKDDQGENSIKDIALAICSVESLRINGINSCLVYSDFKNLANELKNTLESKEIIEAQLTSMDSIILTVKNEYSLNWPISDWLDSSNSLTKMSILERLKADITVADGALRKLTHRLAFIRQELCNTNPDSDIFSQHTGAVDASSSISSQAARQISKRTSRHQNHSRSSTLSAIQVPYLSINFSESSVSNIKQSVLLSSLRISLGILQRERLNEIRQLVKLLGRYETVQSNLFDEDSRIIKEVQSSDKFRWTLWLENHQTWTNKVLNTLKKLSKFITHLSGSDKYSVEANSADVHMESFDEAELASSLNLDCFQIKYELLNKLTLPILDAIQINVETNPYLFNTLRELLQSLRCQYQRYETTITSDIHKSLINECNSKKLDNVQQTSHTPEKTLNIQALSVWHRVCDRLHGYDPLLSQISCNSTEPFSVAGQIDACIREATNRDNLALMYEGWTAWV